MQRFIPLLLILAAILPASAADEPKPVLLYSRYFNAVGESRYLPDGTYRDVLERLRPSFEIRVSDQPLTVPSLRDVAVVLIANPSDKAVGDNPAPHHCTPADVTALDQYVRSGGGIIAMGNQENHNLEINDFNSLLGTFGMRFENLYTDAKNLGTRRAAPLIGGLRWAYYTGNIVQLDRNHDARPHVLVANDLTQKPIGGPRDQEGALIAVSEPGKGRVVVVTDSG